MQCLLTTHQDPGIRPEGGSKHPVDEAEILKLFPPWKGGGTISRPAKQGPLPYEPSGPQPTSSTSITHNFLLVSSHSFRSPQDKNIFTRKALPGQGNSSLV